MTGIGTVDDMNEISEEDSFADDIESIKGEIKHDKNSSADDPVTPIEVADNIIEIEETKEIPTKPAPEKIEKIVEDLSTPKVVTSIESIPDWPRRMDAANYTEE